MSRGGWNLCSSAYVDMRYHIHFSNFYGKLQKVGKAMTVNGKLMKQ